MKEEIEKIHQMIQGLIDRMGCSGTVSFIEYPENLFFTINTRDGGLLIGENGEHLRAFNHIVRKMADKAIKDRTEELHFLVDINDYQRQKIEELKDLARLSAQRVRYFKKEIIMEPMTAYERRIIHATLTEYPDISTQSTGEGRDRRVTIKPL